MIACRDGKKGWVNGDFGCKFIYTIALVNYKEWLPRSASACSFTSVLTVFSYVIAAMAIESTTSNPPSEKGPFEVESSHSNKSDAADVNEKSAVVVDTQDEASSSSISEVFDVKAIDPVLSRKMALVNTAIDEIGMTSFQWKLFWLNGFGYAVDSVCILCLCT